jgi:hypothetical protein
MIIDFSQFSPDFGAASFISLIQMFLGIAASRLKGFSVDKDTYRKRINEITEKSIEELSNLFSDIMNRKIDTDIPLRGEPPHHSDIVAEFHKLIMGKSRIFFQLESDFQKYRLLNKGLFYTGLAGIIILIMVSLFKVDVNFFVMLTLGCVLFEVVSIVLMFIKSEELDKY